MTLDDRIAALAARQHGVVARSQLESLGATEAAIRHRRERRRLVALHPRVLLVSGAPRTELTKVMAAVLAAGNGTCVSHRTAASLFGLPGFSLRSLDLTVRYRRRPRLGSATLHLAGSLPDWHHRVVNAIPTTSIARTMFDLCGSVHPRRAERALDTALARRLVTVPACWRVLADLPEHGRAGTVVMRELLTARGEGYVAPASELEEQLLRLLREAGLPEPAREIDLGNADGWVGRVELVFREAHVLIEADSRLHHGSLLDRQSDKARDDRFEAGGWDVLRFTWEDVTQNPTYVVRTVRAALRSFS